MTFSGANKLKLSQHIFTTTDDQAMSTSATLVTLGSTIYTQQNYFSYTPTVANNRITLPAGEYYLEAAISCARASGGTWYMEYYWRTYDSSSTNYTTIGHV